MLSNVHFIGMHIFHPYTIQSITVLFPLVRWRQFFSGHELTRSEKSLASKRDIRTYLNTTNDSLKFHRHESIMPHLGSSSCSPWELSSILISNRHADLAFYHRVKTTSRVRMSPMMIRFHTLNYRLNADSTNQNHWPTFA